MSWPRGGHGEGASAQAAISGNTGCGRPQETRAMASPRPRNAGQQRASNSPPGARGRKHTSICGFGDGCFWEASFWWSLVDPKLGRAPRYVKGIELGAQSPGMGARCQEFPGAGSEFSADSLLSLAHTLHERARACGVVAVRMWSYTAGLRAHPSSRRRLQGCSSPRLRLGLPPHVYYCPCPSCTGCCCCCCCVPHT